VCLLHSLLEATLDVRERENMPEEESERWRERNEGGEID
jgi:hypothetical protein